MKKKVKKIPKYSNGTPYSTAEIDAIANQIKEQMGQLGTSGGQSGAVGRWKNMDTNQKISTGIETLGAAGNLLNTAMSGQDVTIGGAISATAQGAAAGAKFGPIGAIGGAAVGLAAGTAGRKRGVDYTTGTADMGSGWMKMFGPSKDQVLYKANMAKNSIQSRQQTENLRADYYNENSTGNINMMAAEGGIMRRPVNALVSKGELIYDPTTKKLRQVPGSKGKPNKADDVFAKLYEGDVVISNSPTMLMANGKTPAQNLMGMVDKYATGGTVKAREAIIKKVVNWQEANKTKPQEYAMYNEGYSGFFKHLMNNRTRPLGAVISEWFKQRGEAAPKFDGFGKLDFLNGIKNIYNTQSDYEAPIKLRDDFNWDQHRSVPIDQLFEFNPNALTTKVEKPKNASTGSTAKVNYSPQNVGIHTHSEIDPVLSRHKTSDFVAAETPVTTAPAVSKKKQETAISKKGEANKSSSDKKTTGVSQEEKRTPEQIAESLRIEDIGKRHWLRGPVNAKSSFYTPNGITKENAGKAVAPPLTVLKPGELGSLDESNDLTDPKSNGSNLQDALYRMAVLSQPLWDRAKAEPVDYTTPVYKYMPTQIDVTSQLRDADQSYALARYNFANLYPNTGAGMAAGLQAASDRAKQYADIRQYQTNAQNELIGKNVGIYNNWSNEYARIMNDVYNKTAANRAAARNINRQNRATALNNYGTMLSDDKKMKMEAQNNRLKANMLKPFIESVYENSDELMQTLAPYTMNRNVKKKSSTR